MGKVEKTPLPPTLKFKTLDKAARTLFDIPGKTPRGAVSRTLFRRQLLIAVKDIRRERTGRRSLRSNPFSKAHQ